MTKTELTLSTLPKTWLIDIDGTVLKHNGYLIEGYDTLIDKSVKFIQAIPKDDKIVLLTARSEDVKEYTLTFLKKNNIRFDYILFDLPKGERILINDDKPSGLKMSHAINLKRNDGVDICIDIDTSL